MNYNEDLKRRLATILVLHEHSAVWLYLGQVQLVSFSDGVLEKLPNVQSLAHVLVAAVPCRELVDGRPS